ncbi:MAG: DUF1738 domain-containing protein [Ruminococcaceae bacterium]|nr:DUF1738 domain-containing protein [Oscillospiraceae bacterium]
MSTKFDIYAEVTNRIIKQLEEGVIPWHKPWKTVCTSFIKAPVDLRKVAFNRITKTAYSALNQMLLSRVGEYASFKQWTGLGGKIRKGAKSEMVVFWKWVDIKIEEEDENGEKKLKIKKVPHLRYYQVFHIEDVEGVKPLTLDQITEPEGKPEPEPVVFDPVKEAEALITHYSEREQIKIGYGGDRAYYSPAFDCIQLPQRFQFGEKSGEFYSTAFHEIAHSTGAKHRLDRLTGDRFGSAGYSKEELVAEISAAGMLNLLGIETPATFTNSAAYVQSWIKALKNDTKMIVVASGKAEKAVQYILHGKEETTTEEGAA